jgi:hypothetical protein
MLLPFNSVCPISVSVIPAGVTSLELMPGQLDSWIPSYTRYRLRKPGIGGSGGSGIDTHYSFTSLSTMSEVSSQLNFGTCTRQLQESKSRSRR